MGSLPRLCVARDGDTKPPWMGSRRVWGGFPLTPPCTHLKKLKSYKNQTISLITTPLVPQRPIKV
ncbi:hypothetical protein MSSD14B_21570 [Marinobacter salsuginis]|uniref:Uncharacterized protein n=1 Tax=Marinobacter salsuginis TaxID=418719 RepID=A0A5M3Q0I9_9GAMM|nr:hypothetical protein MSSD14B_21570 [Marinobacter salsuginis]